MAWRSKGRKAVRPTTSPASGEEAKGGVGADDIDDVLLDEICDRMEDLGHSAEQSEGMADAIDNSDKLMLDIIASTIVEMAAMEGRVAPAITTDESQLSLFWKQVYAFVQTNGYPFKYKKGPAEFSSLSSRIEVINWLLSELQACKMLGAVEPDTDYSEGGAVTVGGTHKGESTSASLTRSRGLSADACISQALGDSCAVLGVTCPKSAADACLNISQSIKTIISRLAKAKKLGIIDSNGPILNLAAMKFSDDEWDALCDLNESFATHYTLRKRMLRKRLEVTMDAMLESETGKKNLGEIMAGLRKRQSEIKDECQIPVWSAFAMQRDLFRVDRITTLSSDVDSPVRKHQIGTVPDRGGRPTEVRQVEIDAIPFSSFGGRRRGRGRGRGRGGRGRGGRRGGGGGYRGGGGRGRGYRRY